MRQENTSCLHPLTCNLIGQIANSCGDTFGRCVCQCVHWESVCVMCVRCAAL